MLVILLEGTEQKIERNMKKVAYVMNLRFLQILFLCVVGFMSFSSHAETCRCDSASIRVWPDGKSSVPPSTHIWVRLPAYRPVLPFEKYSDFAEYPRFWSTRFLQNQMSLLLFEKAKNRYVEGYKVDLTAGQWRMSVFYPKSPLALRTTYEIHLLAPGNLRGVLGRFVTGTEAESPKPPAPNIVQARYISERIYPGQCRPPKPFAVLDLKQTPALDPHFYGIWLPNADGKIDDKRMPNLVLQPQQNQLFLGQLLPCSENNFVFPAGRSNLQMVVKVGNLSGQWGIPQSVNLTMQAMMAPWSWTPNARILFWIVLGLLILIPGILRVWLFQTSALSNLLSFLTDHDAIKSDMTWIALKQVVQRDQSIRRSNMILLAIQLILGGVGLYVFWQEHVYFSLSPISRSEIYLVVAILCVVLLLHGIIHLYFTLTSWSRRRAIGALPTSKSFQQASDKLLAGWKK